jgi:hypothetical protein
VAETGSWWFESGHSSPGDPNPGTCMDPGQTIAHDEILDHLGGRRLEDR